MVHTAKKPKAQHQVPNEALNCLSDKLIPLLHLPREDAQWALTQRHFNNKGNSLEVLFFYAEEDEEGSHGDYWQLLWVLFMHQYKDARFPWIVQVLWLANSPASSELMTFSPKMLIPNQDLLQEQSNAKGP